MTYRLGCTRFNRNTWQENEEWRKSNHYEGCIYGTPREMKPSIPISSTIFVFEMHNDENKCRQPTLFFQGGIFGIFVEASVSLFCFLHFFWQMQSSDFRQYWQMTNQEAKQELAVLNFDIFPLTIYFCW